MQFVVWYDILLKMFFFDTFTHDQIHFPFTWTSVPFFELLVSHKPKLTPWIPPIKNQSQCLVFFNVTLPPIIMEVENYHKWKETNIEGTHFSLPWLWEEEYLLFQGGALQVPCGSHEQKPTPLTWTIKSWWVDNWNLILKIYHKPYLNG